MLLFRDRIQVDTGCSAVGRPCVCSVRHALLPLQVVACAVDIVNFPACISGCLYVSVTGQLLQVDSAGAQNSFHLGTPTFLRLCQHRVLHVLCCAIRGSQQPACTGVCLQLQMVLSRSLPRHSLLKECNLPCSGVCIYNSCRAANTSHEIEQVAFTVEVHVR